MFEVPAGQGQGKVNGQDRTPQHVSQRAPGPALLSPAHLYHKRVLQDGNWELEAKIKTEKKRICSHRPMLRAVIYFHFLFTLNVSQRGCPQKHHTPAPVALHYNAACFLLPAPHRGLPPAQPSLLSDRVRRQISCSLMGEC